MTLTEFLLARLAEDEAGAVAAQGRIASWAKADVGPWVTARHISEQVGPGAVLDAFVARHDPARVLAEVEAKRRIVEEMGRLAGDVRPTSTLDEDGWVLLCWETLETLADVYSGHPDYNEARRV